MEPPSRRSEPRPWLAFARFTLGLGVLALVVWWLAPSLEDLVQRVEVRGRYVALAFVGTAAATVVTAWRWQMLTERMGGTPLRYGVYFHYLALTRLLGLFSSTLLMDLLGRGVALRGAGSQRGLGHLMAPVVVERVLDLALPAVMIPWILITVTSGRADSPWASFALTLAVFVVVSGALLQPLTRLALRAHQWFLRRRRPDLRSEPLEPLSRGTIGRVIALAVMRYATIALQFWAAGAAVGVILAPVEILGALPVAQLTAALGITPGGLGIQEAGWAGALRWLERDATSIALFVLAARIVVAANFAVLSLLSRPLLGRSRRPTA